MLGLRGQTFDPPASVLPQLSETDHLKSWAVAAKVVNSIIMSEASRGIWFPGVAV